LPFVVILDLIHHTHIKEFHHYSIANHLRMLDSSLGVPGSFRYSASQLYYEISNLDLLVYPSLSLFHHFD